jgi:hypothetical protein
MKLKMLAAFAAAAVLTGGLASCGSGDDDNDKGSSAGGAKLSGEYCTIVPLTGHKMSEDMSLDDYIEESRDYYAGVDFKELDFDVSDFEMAEFQSRAKIPNVYKGSYKVKDGKIVFNYKTTTVDNNGEKEVYDVADGVPDDDGSKQARIQAGLVKKMQTLNETGTYYQYVGNRIDFSDRYIAYNILPLVVQNVFGSIKRDDTPVYLYPVDDLICVPTYGTELDGSYSYGKDFTIVYNAMDTCLEDEYSRYNLFQNDSSRNNLKTFIEKQLGSTDDTRIEFSGGKWKWYNSAGELINDGIYKESEEYKGLIALFVTEESANPDEYYISMSPEFLYLSGGEVWLPYMMKAE